MNILNRIGKMAEAAWQETAGKLDHHERGDSVIEKLEQRYEEALQRTIELRRHMCERRGNGAAARRASRIGDACRR